MLLLCLMPAGALAEVPRVLVSVLPIHSLVAAVMEGAGSPELLIPGGQSPHHFSLRPSQARALYQADLVVWLGPQMEAAIARGLRQRDREVLTLLDAPGMPALLLPGDAAYADPDHGVLPDGHIWLDPRNAHRIVELVAATLSQIDPQRRELYAANADQARQRLDALDQELAAALRPLRHRPYVVFHDAYRYLQARYEMQGAIAVTVNPEHQPGARRLREIRRQIEDSAARCVFVEPQFRSPLLGVLTEGLDLHEDVLDPLGSDIKPGAEAYFQLLRSLVRSLIDCLQRFSQGSAGA